MASSTPPVPALPKDRTEQSPLLTRTPATFPTVPTLPAQIKPPPVVASGSPGSAGPKSALSAKIKENQTPLTPDIGPLPKADTNMSWGAPAGMHIRAENDENLRIFRRAVGINSDRSRAFTGTSLEEGRKKAVGIYAAIIQERKRKALHHHALASLVYLAHFAQIVIGAILTALGPDAGSHVIPITALGAANTVIAGMLALVKGQGLPERLRKDEMEFRRLQDWIQETDSLLEVGVIGKSRKEVGLLVEVAFKKYNAAKQSEENNLPENYVAQIPDDVPRARSPDDSDDTPSLSDRSKKNRA